MVYIPTGICQFVLRMVIIISVWILHEIDTRISTKAVADWSVKILQNTNIYSLLLILFRMQIASLPAANGAFVPQPDLPLIVLQRIYWIAITRCFWSMTRQQKWSYKTCRVLTKHPANVSCLSFVWYIANPTYVRWPNRLAATPTTPTSSTGSTTVYTCC